MTRKTFPYCTGICGVVPRILEKKKIVFLSVTLWTMEISGKFLLIANVKGI